jgi:hypothetical protein
MRERATTHLAADPATAVPPIPGPGRRGSPPDPDSDPDEGHGAPDAAAIEADRLLVDIDRLLVGERQVGALRALVRVLRVLRHTTPAGLVEIVATLEELRLGADHVEEVLRRLDALADRVRSGDGVVVDRPDVCKRRHLPPDGDGGKPRSGDDRGELLPAGVVPRRHGASSAPMPPGNPQPSLPHADARGHRFLQAAPDEAVGGKASDPQEESAPRAAASGATAPLPPTSQTTSLLDPSTVTGSSIPPETRKTVARTRSPIA